MDDPFSTSPELAAIARRYIVAYGARDVETVMNLFADSVAVRYVGTDQGEDWDRATLRAIFPKYIEDRPEYHMLDADISAFECGAVGFAIVQGVARFPSTGKTVTVRGTYLFTLVRGVWKIVHIHHSSPVPNIDNMGFEAQGLEELLMAAAEDAIDLGQSGMASVMFTDIADSTAIAEAVGDPVWNAAVRRHLDQVQSLIRDGGGRVIKSLGDGTMSTFATARAALSTACAIQRAVAASTTEPHLQLRIGLHTGEIVDSGDDFFGTVVNKAARVAASAGADEIRLSDATRVMVGGSDYGFAEPITVPLKGLEGEHVLYRLDWRA